MNQGPYAGFPRGSSTVSSNSKTIEAQLLSQATKTAVVAAKSILMSGGSEEVALKTAKAAAESVLNPTASDNDTISGRSTTFLRRRKVKRQAEIVASMALTQASNNLSNGQSNDWSANDSNAGSQLNPYTRNITTRSMHTQDEPSVLSTSTSRPPKTPFSQSLHSRTSASAPMYMLTEGANKVGCPPPAGPPLSARVSSLSKYTNTPGMKLTAGSSQASTAQSETNNSFKQHAVPISSVAHTQEQTPMTPSEPLHSKGTADKKESPLPTKDTEDFDDETTFDPDASTWAGTRPNLWTDLDPLLAAFSNVLNILTCGPLVAMGHSSRRHEREATRDVPRRIMRDDEYDTVASALETVDDRDDAGTDFRSLDSYDRTEKEHDIGSSTSGDNSSVDSGSIIRDLQSSSSSEGEIQVRSSIRDTMEKIVSISRKGMSDDQPFTDRRWLSYELKQDERPEAANANVKRKPLKGFVTQKGGKKSFFFNRRAGKK